jgi:hypothetical protein
MGGREASAAGLFYPGKKKGLLEKLEMLFSGLPKQEKARCVVAPHAGYDYSGKAAAFSFSALKENCTFVLMGPSHTGLGPMVSVSDADYWETPIGRVPVDLALREKLLEALGIEADGVAHVQEHSLEVQLPFMQHLFRNFKILPITIMEQRLPSLIGFGEALAGLGKGFSVVASGDFTHYEPLAIAREKDFRAIKKMEAVDAAGFYKEVVSGRFSICGLSPFTAMLHYCKKTGLAKGKLLHYDTSATGTGDEKSVVGYASIGFY